MPLPQELAYDPPLRGSTETRADMILEREERDREAAWNPDDYLRLGITDGALRREIAMAQFDRQYAPTLDQVRALRMVAVLSGIVLELREEIRHLRSERTQ